MGLRIGITIPRIMRWMTVDPIKDGLNWYQYCYSDPVEFGGSFGLEISNIRWRTDYWGY